MGNTAVFICDCGTNIADAVNTKDLAEFAGKIPEVSFVYIHQLLCSLAGTEEMAKLLKENSIQRVVVAACSPKQHEATFQKVLKSAGINPYMLVMVNIREQIAWVTKDKEEATKKAKSLLFAAVKRVQFNEQLEEREIECNNDFLVIGAGAAGVSAALTLAQQGRKVYLVEKEPWIGGKIMRYEDVFPRLECAPCMLEPMLDKVLHNENLELITNASVENVKGFFGSFDVTIHKKKRQIDAEKCIGCNACLEVCPVKTPEEYSYGMVQRGAVYTPFPGVLPNLPAIDEKLCLRSKGETCTKCAESCPFGAINYEEQDSLKEVKVGGIVITTGFELYDYQTPNIPKDHKIINAIQLERLISNTGPTAGKVEIDGIEPKSIVFMHCAGSRDKKYKEYCSGVCCAYILKLAHLVKKKNPNTKIYSILSDWCLPGKGYQEFYNKCSKDIDEQIRVSNPNDIQVKSGRGILAVSAGNKNLFADMLVLAPAMVAPDSAKDVADVLGIETDSNGFFQAEHETLYGANSLLRGVYIAGCATGPKDISQSILQAQAAAGRALSENIPGGKIKLEVKTSSVKEDLCGGCKTCISCCPYQAISFDREKKNAVINEAICRGCGVCVAGCPSGAIENKGFKDNQIMAEIEGVLNDAE